MKKTDNYYLTIMWDIAVSGTVSCITVCCNTGRQLDTVSRLKLNSFILNNQIILIWSVVYSIVLSDVT